MGTPKGLLKVGSETLLERTLRLSREVGLDPVIVGRSGEYDDLARDVARIPDALRDAGPIGGLAALIDPAAIDPVLVVACDMPYITVEDLARLADAPRAEVVAPRRGDWEPLFARYAPAVKPKLDAYLQTGRRSLRGLLDRCDVVELQMDPSHLRDWDTPDDRVP